MAKLTAKQERFVEEYLIDLNATQAAIRAGYKAEHANRIGAENLTKPVIRVRIDEALAERSKRTGINADRVLMELARLAFINLPDVVDPDTACIRKNAAKDDTAALVSVRVKTSESDTGSMVEREARTADKIKALELLGKHLGMFKDKHRVEYDRRRLELEALRIEAGARDTAPPENAPDDGFLTALNTQAGDLWRKEHPDDSREEWTEDDELGKD